MAFETEWTEDVRQKLLAPFSPSEVKFLPKSGTDDKKRGMAYVDSRVIMHRLDDVFGPGGWSFTYDVVPGPSMMVRGSLVVLGVLKCDAGEAGREEEPLKSAVSDALKRTAVHFGIGRYLYALPACYGKYSTQFKGWVRGEEPKLDNRDVARALASVGYTGQIPAASRAEAQSAPAPSNGNGQQRAPESRGDAAATNGSTSAEVTRCVTENCCRPLTSSQKTAAMHKFGKPLCLDCQKTATPVTA